MRFFGRLASLALCGSTAACLSGPGFLKQGPSTLTSKGNQAKASVLADENGVLTAAVDPASGATQLIDASDSSAIAGTQISFPPGAVALATNISVQEGASLLSDGLKSEIGVSSGVSLAAASAAIVIQSSVPMDAVTPFTVAIPVSSSSLALIQEGSVNYAVIYNAYVAANAAYVAGVIPKTELTLVNGTVSFQTSYFGSYQLVTSSVPIVEKKEVATAREVVTKQQATAAPLSVDSYAPYAAAAGKPVTLRGKNFRKSMTIALGAVQVRDVKVMSDVSASFVMPAEVKFGFTDVEIAQDGVSEKGRMFALEQKTQYPLITMDESGVCAGVTYYDANGDKRVGSKACGGGSAGGDVMLKSVYDQNANGKVDGAEAARTADFARGAAGQPLTASGGIIPIPDDGSFFRVTGGGQNITRLSPRDPGTRVSLYAEDRFVLVNNNSTAPRLALRDSGNIPVGPGDVLEFVSLGSEGWAMAAASRNFLSVFKAQMNSTGVAVSATPTYFNWSTELVDTLNSYNGSFYQVKYTGNYLIRIDMAMEYGTYATTTCDLMVVRSTDNGGTYYPLSPAVVASSSIYSMYNCGSNATFTVPLNANDRLAFKAASAQAGTLKTYGTYTSGISIEMVP